MAVLVTRPSERGEQLVETLHRAGIAAIHLPLFTIRAGSELNNLPNQLNQLKAGDYVFVVSQNAINYGSQALKQSGFSWRSDLNYLTVGRQTAQAFSAQTGQTIHYPLQQETSEGVLLLPQMQNLTDKNILILRGNVGRTFLAEQVKLRGATVYPLECYRREPIIYDTIEQTSMLKRAGITCIIATSKEILYTLLDFIPKNEHNWLKSCCLITVSERIQRIALSIGWKKVMVSSRADNSALLEVLLQLKP